MEMKRLIGAIFTILFLFLAGSTWGANTTIYDDYTITITGLDADWTYSTEMDALKAAGTYPRDHVDRLGALLIDHIVFIPGATGDHMIIHGGGGIDASPIFDPGPCADAYDSRVEYYGENGKLSKPVIDISDCTLAAGTLANCVVKIHLKRKW
jgi:hypothetical protein